MVYLLVSLMLMYGSVKGSRWFLLPWLDRSPVRSASYRPLYRKFFYALVVAMVVLFWCGGAHAEEPYIMLSQLATLYYFAHFLVILPLLGLLESPKPLPSSISDDVLAKKRPAMAAVPAE